MQNPTARDGRGMVHQLLDLPGCHSQGETREEALQNIREAIGLWLEVEAEESGVKRTITRTST
jgi:hypothetical protein